MSQSDNVVQRDSWRGWLIWGICASFFAYAFFHRVAPSVMFDHLMRDFAATATILGNLSAFYFYAYAGMQLPVGLMLDRFGPRLLLTVAAIVAGGGSIVFGLAQDLPTAYLGRALIGVGSGVIFLATLTLAALWLPPHRFALAVGLTQSVAMLGAVVGQAPLAFLVDGFGWRPTMLWGAGIGFVFAGILYLVARLPGDGKRVGSGAPGVGGGTRRAVLRNPQTWLAALYCAAMSGPMLAFAVLWGVPWLVQVQGLDRAAAGLGASMMLIGWAAAAPLIGWASDRLGRRKPLMLGCAALTLAGWWLAIWGPPLPTGVLFALFGLLGATSSAMALSFAVVREHNSPAAAGFSTAIANTSSIVAGSVLQVLVGKLLDLGWGGIEANGVREFPPEAYSTAFLIFPLLTALTFVGTLFIRETHCRQQVR